MIRIQLPPTLERVLGFVITVTVLAIVPATLYICQAVATKQASDLVSAGVW